jgi:hypothetical protein
MTTAHYEPELRENLYQGETWNATWLARGPAGQTLLQITATTSATMSTAVSTIGWAIYDQQAENEETFVVEVSATAPSASNPDGGALVKTSAVVNGYSRTSAGHTVHLQLQPAALSWTQVPGHTYRVEVELVLPSAAGGGRQKLVGHCYIKPWFGTE